MVPELDMYSIDTDPAQRIMTADTGCTVHDLDYLDDLDDLDHDLSRDAEISQCCRREYSIIFSGQGSGRRRDVLGPTHPEEQRWLLKTYRWRLGYTL